MNSLKDILEKSMLADIEDTIEYGDNATCIIDFINFLIDSSKNSYKEHANDIINFCINTGMVSCKKNGEIILDISKLPNNVDSKDQIAYTLAYSLLFSKSSFIYFNTKFLPKSLKKLIFVNYELGDIIWIGLYGNNDLPIDITAEGATINIVSFESNNIIKLGKIDCNVLIISDNHNDRIYPVGISLKPGTTIKRRLELNECSELYEIIGKKLNIKCIELHQNFVGNILRKKGVINQDTRVWTSNE